MTRRDPAAAGEITVIGIDCAAQPENTGLARAVFTGEDMTILDSSCASRRTSAASIAADWARETQRVLFALDAPLGWPLPFTQALANHCAGDPLGPAAHAMFRRTTDDEIYARLGKRPMEVAADRIGRAAHSALRMLADLRELLSAPVPMLWSSAWRQRYGAIEVYPAATRIALALIRGSGSLQGLESRVHFIGDQQPCSEHARDAVLCVVAGIEFLLGNAVPPTRQQLPVARREGWIWNARAKTP